jgi:hypothetical protein
MSAQPTATASVIRSLIPARVDRLPWSPFHTRMVIALGVAWVLDGLEITVASSVAGALTKTDTLHMSSTAVGAIATVYLVGEGRLRTSGMSASPWSCSGITGRVPRWAPP